MTTPLEITMIPHDRLVPSPLNPRKTFDAEGIAELAQSILKDGGVLQNLVVRPHPERKGRFEIAAGERRWRAAGHLIERDSWAADVAMPCSVRELDDVTLLKIATIENMQRRALTPLEEAHAYAALVDRGVTTDVLADNIGFTRRYVQKRLRLANDLHEDVKAKLADGSISLAFAEALLVAAPARQAKALPDMIDNPWRYRTADDVKRDLLRDCPPVDSAIFDVAEYDGVINRDPDDPDDAGAFEDADQFRKLQLAAIDRLKGELEAKWAWVRVINDSFGHFDPRWESGHDYVRSKAKSKAGAFIEVTRELSVKVLEGWAERPKAKQPAAAGSAEAPQPAYTQRTLVRARQRKTEALQAQVAVDLRSALVLACLALMGGTRHVRIGTETLTGDDAILAPEVAAIAARFRKRLKSVKFRGDDWTGAGPLRIGDPYTFEPRAPLELAAYEALRDLGKGKDLEALFCALVAARVGTFPGYRADLGDDPVAVKLAADLGLHMGLRWAATPADELRDYLKALRKPRLIALAQAAKVLAEGLTDGEADRLKKGALVDMLLEPDADGVPHAARVLPPELLFAPGDALERATPTVLAPAAKRRAAA